jgi:FHA domain/Transcriptional regulatory protein, C terminal
MTARLVVQAPGAEPHDFPLQEDVATLGRDRECDVVLDYDYVSRRHARVERIGEEYAVVDWESTNGTFVNGQRVAGRQPLAPGDHIDIGDITITFFDAASPDETRVFGPLPSECPIRCDPSFLKVLVRDRPLEARFFPEEFQLLSLLASRFGRVSTREDLGTAIWGRGNFDFGKLAGLVGRVKEKLGPEYGRLIVPVPGRGYKIEDSAVGGPPGTPAR